MIGLGTLINVVAILLGSSLGVAFGHRLPERTTRTVTDALGMVSLVIGAMNIVALRDPDYVAVAGSGTLLIMLAALILGGTAGSLLRIEDRLESFGGWLQRRFAGKPVPASAEGEAGEPPAASATADARARFIEGFVDASLIFCIGPLAVLGSLSDGLGRGIDQLVLKSTMDGFFSIAFASTLGWGVAASAIAVGAYQGALTLLAVALGGLLPAAVTASMTATGGILLLGVGLRLLHIRQVPVGDLMPAILLAPIITAVVMHFS